MKLRDYYNEIVHLNDTETGGWAPAYYGVFSKVINENNYNCLLRWKNDNGIRGTAWQFSLKSSNIEDDEQ